MYIKDRFCNIYSPDDHPKDDIILGNQLFMKGLLTNSRRVS